MPTILVIDDNESVFTALEVLFSLHGMDCLHAAGPEAGMEVLSQRSVDLVIQDMNFSRDTTSGREGVELFGRIRERHPDLPVILLTAWTHLEDAVDLVKAGAADYLAKPWDDDKLLTTVRNLIRMGELAGEHRRLEAQRRRRREELAARFDLGGLLFESEAMQEVVGLAARVAASDVPVMITGPNGVGKERIADIVQANSTVADGPYVKVNVGALPEDLMEAELFGAEAGAYTGIHKTRVGRFELADGGTLFLDEIGELSPNGQVKLLRVLQTGEFERLGSSETRRTRVRVISATNSDLEAAIRDGGFREDLYYRLNVIQIQVPALGERREDVLPLARHFLGPGFRLAPEARSLLVNHPWPGNVRQLENSIRRARLLADQAANRDGEDVVIRPEHLGLGDAGMAAEIEHEPSRAQIESALAAAGGTVARAARALGISRQALYRRMEKYGIS